MSEAAPLQKMGRYFQLTTTDGELTQGKKVMWSTIYKHKRLERHLSYRYQADDSTYAQSSPSTDDAYTTDNEVIKLIKPQSQMRTSRT